VAPRRSWTLPLTTPDGPAPYLLFFFVIAACALLTPPLIEALQFIPLAYNEGWNAYHAFSVREGLPLYPKAGEGLANNYPPLSFMLIALLSKLTGNSDVIFVGRFVALAAFFLVIGLLYCILRAGTVRPWLAATVSLAVLCIIASTSSIYIAISDPLWLAQAFSLAGATLLVRRPPSTLSCVASATMMLAGGFVKNVVLAIPSTAGLWLLLKHRGMLLRWIFAACMALGAALSICWLLYGVSFFHSLLGTPRVFSVRLALENLHDWRYAVFPGCAIGAASAAYLWHRRRASEVETFAILYFACSLLWLAPMLCGAGIWFNSLFEPLLACALVTGLALELALRENLKVARAGARVRRCGDPPEEVAPMTLGPCHAHVDAFDLHAGTGLWVSHLSLILLAILVANLSTEELLTARERLKNLPQREADTREIVQRLSLAAAPVACETLALCFWAGKHVEFDFFNRGQNMTLNPAVLQSDRADIEREKYDIIQFSSLDKLGSLRFPEPINHAIERHYRIDRVATIGALAVRIHPK